MRTTCLVTAFALTLTAVGQEPPLPPATPAPALVLDPGGPAGPVAAVAFSPDSGTLYVGGADKQVRRFVLAGGKFAPADPARLPPLRVPVGLGNAGAVNAVAVSPDGKWVAVAGRAPFREEAWFGDVGTVVNPAALSADQKRDFGVVYLFDPTNPGGGRVLRGSAGEVRALAFAQPNPAGGPVIVAAAREWAADGKRVGAVRVFDVTTGKEVAARADLPVTAVFPGLAVWPAGKGVRVAVAWPNPGTAAGKLLVWDTTTNQSQTFDDGAFNRALALRLGPDGSPRELWSGGFQNLGTGKNEHGRLTIRPLDRPADGRAVAFGGGKQFYLPLTVAIGGDTAAALFEVFPPPDKQYRATELRFLAPDGVTRRGVALRGVALAPGVPVLAASPDGKWVAVGGFADHRVEVYSAAGPADPQRLPGAAGGYTAVSFLAGDRLRVSGGLTFDLRGRTAGPAAGGAVDAPPGTSTEWQAGPGPNAVTVRAAGRAFTLRDGERADAVAYLPAGVPWGKGFAPIVAVAHTEPAAGVSLVTLFDAKSGRRLRQLSGPLQPVRALAFSGTRPLLAGAGDDPTVFVWSLKDLATAEGAIDGLFVTSRGGAVVVESVEATSPARGKLAPGDVIAAVGGPEGNLKPVTQPHEFRDEVAARPVDSTVRVQVKGAAAPVALPVGRGVGQRGPLFTLWAAPTDKPGPREWIGWSPGGPYDASSAAAEDRIGWLTATGNPAQPTTFAGAGQYRKQFYRRGVLEQLVEKGELGPALAALPPPQPPALVADVTPLVNAADGTKLLRDPNAKLDVTLLDPDDVIPLDRAVLRWRATGPDGKPGEWQRLPFPGRSATLDLAKHPWARGAHTFELALDETPESSAPAVTASVSVTFVLPPPKVVAVRVGGKVVESGVEVNVEENAVAVSADVEPGPGGAVEVSLTTSGPGGDRPQKLATKDGKAFGPLAARLNESEVTVIRVTATAEKAGDFAKYESGAVEFRVKHVPKPPPVPPPGLRLTLVTAHEPPAEVGGPLVVDSPAATLTAAVKADKPVELIEWDLDDGKGWVAGTLDPKALTDTATVKPFEPGRRRTVRVRARHAGGEFATDAVSVVYHPRPPAAAFAGLPPGVVEPALVARGTSAQAAGPFEIRVVVTGPRPGESRSFPATATPGPDGSGTWQAAVTLFPGANRLAVVASNRWRTREAADRPEVVLRRPPAVVAVEPVSATAGGTADLVARVVTLTEAPPAALVVNGRTARAEARRAGGVFGFAWWEVKVAGVSIKSGGVISDEVAVAAANAEGEGRPLKAVVRKEAPPPKPVAPPVIVLDFGPEVNPRETIPAADAKFTFKLKVSSERRLSGVELRFALANHDEQTTRIDPGADGLTATAAPTLALRGGVTRVRVVASNAGGVRETEFLVRYTPPAVRVVIDRIEEVGPDGKVVRLSVPTPGPVAASGAFLEVHGHIEWTADGDPIATDPSLEVVVSANRVAHLPVPCGPRAGAENKRPFTAPVFLNATETSVKLDVRTQANSAGLPQQGLAALELACKCDQPLTTQRLHVLVIGVETPEGERLALVRRVVAAVGGRIPDRAVAFDRGEFPHRAFTRAVLYEPLVRDVAPGDVVGLFREVDREVRQTAAREGTGWVNDVVLVYYEGRDTVGADHRRRLHTHRSLAYATAAGEKHTIRLEDLPATPGVRLIVLSVVEPKPSARQADAIANNPPHLRYVLPNAAAREQLLALFSRAVDLRSKVGGVIDWVGGELDKQPAGGKPTDEVPGVVRQRVIGTGAP